MATCLWYLLSLSKPVLRNTQRHSIAKQRRMSLTEAERRHQGTSAWSRVPSVVPPLCFLTLSDHLSDHLYALFIYNIYIYQLNSTDRSDSWNSSLSSSIAYVSYIHTAKVATEIAGQSLLCLSGWSERTFFEAGTQQGDHGQDGWAQINPQDLVVPVAENVSSSKHRN